MTISYILHAVTIVIALLALHYLHRVLSNRSLYRKHVRRFIKTYGRGISVKDLRKKLNLLTFSPTEWEAVGDPYQLVREEVEKLEFSDYEKMAEHSENELIRLRKAY
jgi:hypothetical protein